MADMTPSRLGAKNGTGADDALFLKQFSGEVLTAFDRKCIMKDRHKVRVITNGKSAQFPATWRADARYHVPGTQIIGQTIKASERTLTSDGFLISDVSIAAIDEAMNHYDVRGEYTKQVGQSLAVAWDKKVLQVGVNAARVTTPTIDEGPLGGAYENANVATSVNELEKAFKAAAIKFDENEIDQEGRFAVLRPAQFWLLSDSDKLVNSQYSVGNGDYATGKVLKAANIQVLMSNNLPSTAVAAGTGEPTNPEYYGDFSKTVGLIMNDQAVGTIQLVGIDIEGKWMMEYQVTLIVAKYAMGHGILRPECAFEIRSGALA